MGKITALLRSGATGFPGRLDLPFTGRPSSPAEPVEVAPGPQPPRQPQAGLMVAPAVLPVAAAGRRPSRRAISDAVRTPATHQRGWPGESGPPAGRGG